MASSCLLRLGRALVFVAAILLFPSAVAAKQSAADVSIFPAPGSYALARIFKAPDSWVLEHSPWLPLSLSSFTSGKVTLLSFFYSTCRDPTGCPAIWSTFETIHDVIKKKRELNGKVRLVLVSLDPGSDTPYRLEIFSKARKDTQNIAPWHFLTTWSDWFLSRILEEFGQSAGRDMDGDGNRLATISHQVKFYLIDKNSWVREIYTSNFITPEVVENDVRTLLMEAEELPANRQARH